MMQVCGTIGRRNAPPCKRQRNSPQLFPPVVLCRASPRGSEGCLGDREKQLRMEAWILQKYRREETSVRGGDCGGRPRPLPFKGTLEAFRRVTLEGLPFKGSFKGALKEEEGA